MFLIDKITVSSLINLKIFLVFVENSFFQGIQSFGNSKCLSCASFRKKKQPLYFWLVVHYPKRIGPQLTRFLFYKKPSKRFSIKVS